MKLWERRPVRHMVFGLVPLLLIGAALIVVLATKYENAASVLNPLTERAQGTTTKAANGKAGIEFSWADKAGQSHVDTRVFPSAGDVPAGTKVNLFYDPADPRKVYAPGDEQSTRVRTFYVGLVFVGFVLLVALLVTAVWILRRARMDRRRSQKYKVSWARSQRGLIRRSWLVVDDGEREWWQPVYWSPGLRSLLAETPTTVYGNPKIDKQLAAVVDGDLVWPAGRRRTAKPRGELIENTVRWTKGLEREREKEGGPERDRITLRRHLLGDIALVFPAPILGVLWAYLSGSGAGGFAVGTLLLLGVLFWLPSIFGSDPT